MERILALLATLAAGGLVALQPPINAQLAKHTSVIAAVFVSFLVGTLVLAVVLVVSGSVSDLGGLGSTPLVYLTGGLIGVALVGTSLVTVGTLGAGGVVAATVATQLIVSAVLDRAGVLGLDQIGLTPLRLTGFALLLAGTLLVTIR